MALTLEQREARRKYIGSSDAAAIVGCDPFKSAYDVWVEKTGRVDSFAGNEHTARGNYLEPAILNWAEERLGLTFSRHIMQVHPDLFMAANFDGIREGDADAPFIVEAKSSANADEWGEPGTADVPERVLIQVHHAMYVAGPFCRVAFVPVLVPAFKAFDFRMYRVDRDDELADGLARRATAFMVDNVRADVPPDDSRPSLDVLRRIRREPNKVVAVPDGLIERLRSARLSRTDAEREVKEAESALLTEMGDAEGATDGTLTALSVLTKRAGYTVDATEYRTLRIKGFKPGEPAKG